MKIRTIAVNQQRADQAFAAHAALLKAERDDPRLSRNPYWTMLRQDAFEAFSKAFEVLK